MPYISPVPLTPLPRSVPLAARISGQLREEIAAGAWPVGSRIPGEHQLVELLGVSRNTVREALRSLVHAGLLEARPGDGTYVRASSELEVALQRRASAEEAIDVFEVREALEIHAVRLAAERAGDDDIDYLRKVLAARDAATEPAARLDADLRYHAAVVEVSGNRLLLDVYRHLDRGATYLPEGASEADVLHLLIGAWDSHDPHHDIFDAISRHDPDAAAAAATALIQHAREAFLRAVPQD